MSLKGIHTFADSRIGFDRRLRTLVGELQNVWEGSVSEGQRRRVGHSTGHVRHAVMDHSVNRVGRIAVGSRLSSLDAPALIDGDVNDYGTTFHVAHRFPSNKLRSSSARNQDATDHKVGFGAGLADGVRIRG